ncbi:MAG: radical SAM family heme chaperone HemW [Bacillota bacterium]|nr:radical SAM family heme chaperone HemW [Bacillota bacterium]MDD3298157.1 radical SAM family heme chaperone HemW [Bacillota bacterium]MDD3850363.1 radical SAM family heme chaperone HemW [Bacillota bacterium]MDD4708071.1 radical SAM family heme chaperone HemW [Bacillota bacterium]
MEYALYVHIPFCIKKCHYCDFVSFPGMEDMQEDYVAALLAEMALYRGRDLRTVYLGGGTPTCMDPVFISRILEGIGRYFGTSRCVEVSIEANPGTLSDEMLDCLKKTGINRLSIGLQSWNPDELKVLGRVHNRADFIESYRRARKKGFDNINIDLIFGIPGQTMESWAKTLESIAGLRPEHISCYSLKIEEGTAFHRMLSEGVIQKPDPDLDRDMYHFAVDYLCHRGYERYEISNFAKKGRECVHNLAYWDNRPYTGIGVAAHSYGNGVRRWNTADIHRYCSMLKKGLPPVEGTETLSASEEMFETIFLKLRTRWGIDFKEFEERFGKDLRTLYGGQLEGLEKDGFVETDGRGFWLTPRGIDLSNRVFVQFLI